jgi:hypothetical protein
MIFALRFKINLMRFLGGSVVAKPFGFTIDGHTGTPLILKPNHTHETRFVSAIWLTDILRITIRTHIAQVFKSVIRFGSVDVVDQPCGPRASHIQPRKSVRFVNAAFNPNGNVTYPLFFAPRNVANADIWIDDSPVWVFQDSL